MQKSTTGWYNFGMRFEFLAKHFPLPKFLKPKHIGLSFSDSNIKAISIEGNHHKPDLKSIIVPLEEGTIVGGKVLDIEKLSIKLSVVKEYLGNPHVVFTIPDELVYTYQATIPFVNNENESEAVAFTIEENVPLGIADTVFDFIPTKILKPNDEYEVGTVVVACVKKEVEKFCEAIAKSGLILFGAINESQAIASAVISKTTPDTFCIVHARKDRVGIYLVQSNIVHFSTIRSILPGDYRNQFLDEYKKFLEYSVRYSSNGDDQSIKSVFVCGDFEYAKKVVEVIIESGENSVKNAKLSNVWINILKIEETTPSVSYEDSLNFAGPLGATLTDIL